MFLVYVNFTLHNVNSQHSNLFGYLKTRKYLCQH